MEIKSYYKNPWVRQRMIDFLGGAELADASCMYITKCTEPMYDDYEVRPPWSLDEYLDKGFDLHRSLWDRESLVFHLDIEYNNSDFPAEPYLDPSRTFQLQQPVEFAIEKFLLEYGIRPLHLLTGRGHHFLWRVRRSHPVCGQLAQAGCVPPGLQRKYRQPLPPLGKAVSQELGSAFSGLGMVIEYFSHRVIAASRPLSEIPVELADIAVRPQQRGREMISIDITEYGDPLYSRMIRIPFSVYLKPWQKYGVMHERIRDLVPIMFVIPLHEIDSQQGIRMMRDSRKVAALAERASVDIPEQSAGTVRLVEDYLRSRLARFHRAFYADEHDLPEQWPRTYDQTPLERLPPCVRQYLLYPNDLLLKPDAIRQVVRVLLALGWRARHIAGLIRSKYERDFHWGKRWDMYDGASRADFYVRCFTGMIELCQDQLDDFTCQSSRESQLCVNSDGSCSLEPFRRMLLEKIEPCFVGR
jgi:hypothetical protein